MSGPSGQRLSDAPPHAPPPPPPRRPASIPVPLEQPPAEKAGYSIPGLGNTPQNFKTMQEMDQQLKLMREHLLALEQHKMAKEQECTVQEQLLAQASHQVAQQELVLQRVEQETLVKSAVLKQLQEEDQNEREAFEKNLEAMQEELDKQKEEFETEQKEFQKKREKFEKRGDVASLRQGMEADKKEFDQKLQEATASFDAMVSKLEKKHQTTLKDVREAMSESLKHQIQAGFQDQLKEQKALYEQKLANLKTDIEKDTTKNQKDDASKSKVLMQKNDTLNRKLEEEKVLRTTLQREKNELTEALEAEKRKHGHDGSTADKMKALRERFEEEKHELVENYEERLALLQSKLEHRERLCADRFADPEALSSVLSSPTRAKSSEELKQEREDRVVEMQNKLLQAARSPQSADSSSLHQASSSSSGFTRADHDGAAGEEAAARKDHEKMEEWIQLQCLDMGIEDISELDQDLRGELERAYHAQ